MSDDILALVDQMLGGGDDTNYITREIINEMFVLDQQRNNQTNPYIHPHGSELKEGFEGDWRYCFRKSLLQEFYVYPEEEMSVDRLRINKVGWYVHFMIQRLWKGSKRAKVVEVEKTHKHERYGMFYTPDIVTIIPELFDQQLIIVEIKSMNKKRFEAAILQTDPKKMHREAYIQCQIYMYFSGARKGMILLFCKDNSQHHHAYIDYDPEFMHPYIERAETRLRLKVLFETQDGALPNKVCKSQDVKRAQSCPVAQLCWMKNAADRAPYRKIEIVEQQQNSSLIHEDGEYEKNNINR